MKVALLVVPTVVAMAASKAEKKGFVMVVLRAENLVYESAGLKGVERVVR